MLVLRETIYIMSGSLAHYFKAPLQATVFLAYVSGNLRLELAISSPCVDRETIKQPRDRLDSYSLRCNRSIAGALLIARRLDFLVLAYGRAIRQASESIGETI